MKRSVLISLLLVDVLLFVATFALLISGVSTGSLLTAVPAIVLALVLDKLTESPAAPDDAP